MPEVLIAAMIMLLMALAAWVLMCASQQTWAQGDAMVMATDQLRQALDTMSASLRQARARDLARPNPPNTNLAALGGTVTVFVLTVNGTPVRYRLLPQPNGLKQLVRDDGSDATTDNLGVAQDVTWFSYACPAQPACPDTTGPSPTSLLGITVATTHQARLVGGGQRPISTQMTTQVALRRGT